MNAYTFHITPYDLAFLGTIFIGLTFILQLWFTPKITLTANRFLSLALATIVSQVIWALGIDIHLAAYFPRWNWLPLQFSLVVGPLIFFYALKTMRPQYKFRWKDLLHFSPLLLQQGAFVLEVKESIRTGAATFDTLTFQQLSPVLQLLAFISVVTYLYLSFTMIGRFYRRLKFNNVSDRDRYQLRWLRRLLAGFGLIWLLWIPFTAVDYFYYHHQLGIHVYYPLYLMLALVMIWIAVVAFLRPEVGVQGREALVSKPSPSRELKQKGTWLKKTMETNLFYQDAELTLSSLAEKLDMHPHELSRIINIALKKNFNGFVNEYRVRDMVRMMQDPAYNRLTLLGIAFDSGFNSKTTFNRAFRQTTGKSPAEYKNNLKKERPFYFLEPYFRSAAVISCHEATPVWSHEKLSRNYMIKNYFKTTWRSLLRNKAQTFINISGLSIGLACSLFIFLWVRNELSTDAFFTSSDRIYTVYERQFSDSRLRGLYNTPALLAGELKREIPDIAYATAIGEKTTNTFRSGAKMLKLAGCSADSDFFKVFSYRLLEGTPAAALNSAKCLAISKKMAISFFGSPQAAVGKTLRYEDRRVFKVTAVYDDIPHNASLQFDFVLNWFNFRDEHPWTSDWGYNGPQTVVLLKATADPATVAGKLQHFLDHLNPNQEAGVFTEELDLQRYRDAYLHGTFTNGNISGGRIEYVRLFGIVAVFILLIACINFMNLATARSVKRAREIGVRKVVGALRGSLIPKWGII